MPADDVTPRLLVVRVAVCMQCVAVCCAVFWARRRRDLVWGSVVRCVAVCCSVLQCVAVCCSVLQCVAQKT